jgi:hypothetical protein
MPSSSKIALEVAGEDHASIQPPHGRGLLEGSGAITGGRLTGPMLVRLVKPLVLSPSTRQTLRRYLSTPNHRDLVVLKELVESGKLTPHVRTRA